jgi:quercetin dioxygenase-like cupin family protein
MIARSLAEYPLHLGLGARAEPQPRFTGPEFYADYAARTAGDGAEGRLVSLSRFAAPWTSWEMHPAGDEVVVCTEGHITLIQEQTDGSHIRIALAPGDYAINPAGIWHTADTDAPAAALFITAGQDTEGRPR